MLLPSQTSVRAIEGQGGTGDLLWACFPRPARPGFNRGWHEAQHGVGRAEGGKSSWFLCCSPPPETLQHIGES